MTFQPGASLYAANTAVKVEDVEVPFISDRAPTTTDFRFPIGKKWVQKGVGTFELVALTSSQNITTATWVQSSPQGGGGGGVATVSGTANEITATTVGDDVTLSLPNAITTPGSLSTTTSLTAGNGFTVTQGTTSVTGTTNINTSGSAITTIGTGGTGAVNIGNETGNTSVTGTLTASLGLNAFGGTSELAGIVNIAQNGTDSLAMGNENKIITVRGKLSNVMSDTTVGYSKPEYGYLVTISNPPALSIDSFGVTDAMVGGTVTVLGNLPAAGGGEVMYWRKTAGGTLGELSVSVNGSGDITFTSTSNTETSTILFWVIQVLRVP